MNSKKNINFGEGGLLCWIKNELIWNLGGGVFYVGSKMNSKKISIWGGVFYIGSKMNSFGIWGGGLLRWIKNELIWNLGGGSFTLDQK